MVHCDTKRGRHEHKGHSSEKRLDKAEILSSLHLCQGMTVLDAGCGDGYMAKEFSKMVGETGKVYALEFDEDRISVLRPEVEGSNIEVFVGDITSKTKPADGHVDLVYICMVVHGFTAEQMSGFASEVKRLLKPGGRLAVLEWKKQATPVGPDMDIKVSPEELQQAMGWPLAELKELGQYFYLAIFVN